MNLKYFYNLGQIQTVYLAYNPCFLLLREQRVIMIDNKTIVRNNMNNHISNNKLTMDKTNVNDNELMKKNTLLI